MSRKSRKRERAGAARGTEEATRAQGVPPWLDRETIILVVALKALLLVFGVVGYTLMTNQWVGSPYGWLEKWNHFDGPHYLDIARDGYVTTDLHSKDQRLWIVFFPLYPWAVRLCSVVLRDHLLSAHVVTLLGAVAAGLALLRLASLDLGERLARAAVFLMFIFPTAYFFHTVYTESVFMALALGCFLAARGGHWRWAVLLAALACMTRVTGLMLVPAMAAEAFTQYREGGRRFNREWLLIPLAGAGFLVYLLINYSVWGDPFYFQKVLRQYWFKSLTWPWSGVANTLAGMPGHEPFNRMTVGYSELFFVALGLLFTVWSWLRLRPSYSVWMTANWLLFTSTSFIMSTPRYTLTLFPIYILLARWCDERPLAGRLVTTASLLLFGLFAALHVQGQWAF
jgi:hypothetical protein